MSVNELLLERVFSYPILYDTNHKDFKNVPKKDRIWVDIGKDFKIPGEDLKKKWKNLRDTYTKYLRSIRSNTGKEKKNYKKWKWAPHMEKFKPFLAIAKSETNVGPTSADSSDEIESDDEDGQELLNGNNDVEERDIDRNSAKIAKRSASITSVDNLAQNSAKIAKLSASITSVDNLVQYLIRQNKLELDATDHFMLGFSKTIKTLSPRRQVEIKMEISQLVFQKELEELDDD